MGRNGVAIRTGARIHVGFRNLSPARARLFGGIGLAVEEPGFRVTARPAPRVDCPHPRARRIARHVVTEMDVPGAAVDVTDSVPTHAGYGSGTQLTLAVAVAIARAHDRHWSIRSLARRLGRGDRSGVGVACFEHGGFVVDVGHPTAEVTPDYRGERVPAVDVREPIPETWRFVLVEPAVDGGRSGDREDRSIERTIAAADADRADQIEYALSGMVLPGIRDADVELFGAGITRVDRLTGEWFAAEQGEARRPPLTQVVSEIEESGTIAGWGQSSWGPLCYGVTTRDTVSEAVQACEAALDRVGVEGSVTVTQPRNRGADVQPIDGSPVDQLSGEHQ